MPSLPDYNVWEAEQIAAGVSDCERSARWWDMLADAELDRGSWDKFSPVNEFLVNSYRRTAEALRIEERTGIAVCSCCHKPYTEGPVFLRGLRR